MNTSDSKVLPPISKPRSSRLAFSQLTMPMIRPSYNTAIRSERSKISSKSSEINRTPLPLLRWLISALRHPPSRQHPTPGLDARATSTREATEISLLVSSFFDCLRTGSSPSHPHLDAHIRLMNQAESELRRCCLDQPRTLPNRGDCGTLEGWRCGVPKERGTIPLQSCLLECGLRLRGRSQSVACQLSLIHQLEFFHSSTGANL